MDSLPLEKPTEPADDASHPDPEANITEAVEAKNSAEKEVCTICLSEISERAVATPCNHLAFDYLCLVQWVQTVPRCPLCSAKIEEIQYDFRGPGDYRRYVIPAALDANTLATFGNLRVPRDRSRRRRPTPPEAQVCQPLLHPSLATRRYIYEHSLYSLHVGSNQESGYREYSTDAFSESQELQSRARAFLRRELVVLDSMLRPQDHRQPHGRRRPRGQQATVAYLVEFIIAVLRTHDPRAHDARAEELLTDFMPVETTRLLLHELTAWLRSPFTRLHEWDEAVQYPGITMPA